MFIKRLIDYVSLNLSGNRSSILYLIISTRVLLMCPQLAHFFIPAFLHGCVKVRWPKVSLLDRNPVLPWGCQNFEKGYPCGAPFQSIISQYDDSQSTSSPPLLPPRGEDWKLGWVQAKYRKGDGKLWVPRNSITKLHCHWLLNSWPTRGSETHKSLLWIAQ